MKKIYLDYNATTPLDPRVHEEMQPYLTDMYGNPSSVHTLGSEGKAALDNARERVAGMIGASDSEIYFTSCGSESNNFAIQGIANQFSRNGAHLITTQVEHASVLETFKYLEKHGFAVTYLSVDRHGIVDLDQLSDSITDQTVLVSVIYANNETGVVSPIEQICEITNDRGVLLHVDSVQAAGKIPICLSDLPVDMMSISSHKLYGPKGSGALFIRKGTDVIPLIHGGGQERGKRSGTENVASIVGFGRAAELINENLEADRKFINRLRDDLERKICSQIEGVQVNGHVVNRLSNTLNVSIDGTEGESLVMNLDLEGIAASTGSACSEGNVDPSHVLLAMGLSRGQAVSSLRFSFGRFSKEDEVNSVVELLPGIVERIRSLGQLTNQ